MVCCASIASAQINSTRVLSGGNVSWFDDDSWSNGTPNGAGDVAQLELDATGGTVLTLPRQVTVEQLLIEGNGFLTLGGEGPLEFLSGGDGLLLLSVSSGSVTQPVSLDIPVVVGEPKVLNIDVHGGSVLKLEDSVQSSGGLLKTGDGEFWLVGDAMLGDTHLGIEGGAVVASSVGALGNPAVSTTVRSGGRLVLRHDTAESLQLDGGLVELSNLSLSGPVALAGGGGEFYRKQNPLSGDPNEPSLGPTALDGVISGAGDLRIRNDSRDPVLLNRFNTYTGHTYITAGDVHATNSNSLGTAGDGVTISGGRLFVEAPTGDQFRVEGGELRLQAGDFVPTAPIDLAGGAVYFPDREIIETQINLEGSGGKIVGASDQSRFIGPVYGEGDLEIDGGLIVESGLSFDGNLTLRDATLASLSSSFRGEMYVLGNVDVNGANSLGRPQVIRIQNGHMTFNVTPHGQRDLRVESGTLSVMDRLPFNVTLGSSSGEAIINGGGELTGRLTVAPGSSRAILRDAVVNAQISNDTLLTMAPSDAGLQLNVASPDIGPVVVTEGAVNLNQSGALKTFNTSVDGGTLNVNAPIDGYIITREGSSQSGTVAFNVDQDIAGPWVAHSGIVTANAEVGVDRLVVLGGHDRPWLQSDGGRFHINQEFVSYSSAKVDAAISGDGALRSYGEGIELTGDLSQFSGAIHAENGTVYLSESAASSYKGAYYVSTGATLSINGSAVLDNDIFLDPAAPGAPFFRSPLNSESTFRGSIHIGETGSAISGDMRIEGQVVGDNLTINHGDVTLAAVQTMMGGVLRLRDGELSLTDDGSLQGVEQFVLEHGSDLRIYDNTAVPTDRIGDDIRVRSQGSSIWNSNQETIGHLELERGVTTIHANFENILTIAQLSRGTGATLHQESSSGTRSVKLLNPVTLQDGMLGGWATIDEDFATLSAENVMEKLSATTSDLDSASISDHVKLDGEQLLYNDVTVASLNAYTQSVYLRNHQLTVTSGGILSPGRISNGRLTAGESGDAELFIHNGGHISADIVDNSAGGSVSLVVTESFLQLEGDNSYTGGTWVHGSSFLFGGTTPNLRILDYDSIPENERVFVDGGIYSLSGLPEGDATYDQVHIRSGGRFIGGDANIDANEIVLEDGEIQAKLVGAGSVVKQTNGVVEFRDTFKSPDFTGVVNVQAGVLDIRRDTLPNAQFVVEGGRLWMSGGAAGNGAITLDGGALVDGATLGELIVQSDSELHYELGSSFQGVVRGDGDLVIRGQAATQDKFVGLLGDTSGYTGDIRVASGNLRIGGDGAIGDGSGLIDIEGSGRLLVGPASYRDPPSVMPNPITIHGGALQSTPAAEGFFYDDEASPAIISGDVTVFGDARIGATRPGYMGGEYLPGLELTGSVILSDGAQVFGTSDTRNRDPWGDAPLAAISGELVVGADTTWHLLTSTLGISGHIRAGVDNAAINFVGRQDFLRFDGARIQADAGRRLSVSFNDADRPIELLGEGAGISGGGELAGEFTLSNGANVTPGESAGRLTIDGNIAIEEGSRLEIEIGGRQQGVDFDHLSVTGELELDGALLDVSFLDNFQPTPNDAFEIVHADRILGSFANAASSLIVDGFHLQVHYYTRGIALTLPDIRGDYSSNGAIDAADYTVWRDTFGSTTDLRADGNRDGIINGGDFEFWRARFGDGSNLNAAATSVPEPASVALMFAGVAALAGCRRRSKRSASR